jgi:hypothetical protein
MAAELMISLLFRLFMIAFLGIILIVGLFLVIRAYKIKAIGFYYAGFAWLLMVLAQILNQIFSVDVMIYALFSKASFVSLVIFTNLVFHKFHKEKKSFIPKIILTSAIIFGIVAWYFDSVRGSSQSSYYLSRIFDFIQASISLDWLAVSCFISHKNFKKLKIAPWIKVRYKIVYIFSPIFTLIYLILIFQPYDLPFGDTSTILGIITYGLTVLVSIIYSLAFALAWIMPDRFKNYFNRGFNPLKEEEMSEDDLMKLIRQQREEGLARGNY